MIYALIAAVLAFIAGWFSAPVVLIKQSGDCDTETLFIYDEPHKTVTSQAHWFVHTNAKEFYYQAKIVEREDNQSEKSTLVHRTANVDWKLYTDSLSVHTIKTFRIAGPETNDPAWGRYIDPLAETGYTNRIYLFRTEGGRNVSGYRNIPISMTKK